MLIVAVLQIQVVAIFATQVLEEDSARVRIHEHSVVAHAGAQRHPPRQVCGLVGVAQQAQVHVAQLRVAQHGRRRVDGIDGDLFGLLGAQRRRGRQRHHRHVVAAGADHPVGVEIDRDLRRIDGDAFVHLAEEFVLPIG